MPDTKEPASIVFVIAADGTVKRLLYSTDIPFGRCIGSKVRAIKTLPKPPRDNWVVALGAANHHHEEQARSRGLWTNRRPPVARSRWRHMIEPLLLTSRRLALLTLPLRSVISLAYQPTIRSLYGLDSTKTTRKPVRTATKTFRCGRTDQ